MADWEGRTEKGSSLKVDNQPSPTKCSRSTAMLPQWGSPYRLDLLFMLIPAKTIVVIQYACQAKFLGCLCKERDAPPGGSDLPEVE
jgi:hypothetical protein